MSFCVLIAGSARFEDYPALRAALDVLLSNRLPDVVFLIAGGPGTSLLTASYAAVHRLEVITFFADREQFPLDAEERRDLAMVAEAEAAVIL
jgi:hypothetical protein